jgi:hypothetical protein
VIGNTSVINKIKLNRQLLIDLFVCVFVTLCVYVQTVQFDFVAYDDDIHVYNNPLLNPNKPVNPAPFWKERYRKIYIPVTFTLWSIQANLAKRFDQGAGYYLDPIIFHLSNVLFHVICSVLVFLLFTLLGISRWGVVGGTLFFSIHPIQVETVAWVSAFRDVASWLFVLLSVLLFMVFNAKQSNPAEQNDVNETTEKPQTRKERRNRKRKKKKEDKKRKKQQQSQ